MGIAIETAPPEEGSSFWERGYGWAAWYGPYATLGLGTVLAFAIREGQDPLVTGALAAAGAAWIRLLGPRGEVESQGRLWLYFVGYLVLGAVMMAYHPLFLIFPVAAFFQAHLLTPAPFTFLGVFLASLVVNSLIVTTAPTGQNLGLYAVVVLIQTLAIGFGVIGGEKLNDLSESRRRAVVQLEKALEENEGLHAQLVAQAREAGVADERQRLAREIHDTIAQGITAVITQLEAAGHVIDDRKELQWHLENASGIARDSLVEARRAVRAAVPLPLEGRTLPEAVGDVVERWAIVNEVDVEWSITGDPIPLHPEIEVTLLRAVQEAMANVAKHAAASRVAVTMSYMDDVTVVDIRDDGKGFQPNSLQTGYGLRGMRSRVEDLGGELQVESELGRGTAISATMPAIGVDDG